MIQNLSSIQNHILSRLKNAKTLRYSEMQPEKMPNDLYNYHLQFLVKKGFVSRSEEGYSLSDMGIKHVADPYPTNDAITSLFKLNVITIVSRINNGKVEILNQVRTSNPSYGKVGIPGGVVLKGERTEDAASRKLKVETGLLAEFRIVGCERRMLYKGGELFSDVLFPIAYADECAGKLIDTEFGHNKWVPLDEAIGNESAPYDSIPSIVKILEALKKGKLQSLQFYYVENIQSDIIAGQ